MSESKLIKGEQITNNDQIDADTTLIFVLPGNGIEYMVVVADCNYADWPFWWVYPSAELSNAIGCVPNRVMYVFKEHLYHTIKPEMNKSKRLDGGRGLISPPELEHYNNLGEWSWHVNTTDGKRLSCIDANHAADVLIEEAEKYRRMMRLL